MRRHHRSRGTIITGCGRATTTTTPGTGTPSATSTGRPPSSSTRSTAGCSPTSKTDSTTCRWIQPCGWSIWSSFAASYVVHAGYVCMVAFCVCVRARARVINCFVLTGYMLCCFHLVGCVCNYLMGIFLNLQMPGMYIN
uniref:Uncharacterized protein n=1 Tax=Triticum urartu TaxID=4572 RepID=A0A8R7VAT7_TRIUA